MPNVAVPRLSAGTFSPNISFWIDDDISAAGSGANGGLGDGYLKFNDLGHYLHLPTNSLNLRFGQFELDLPFTQARTIDISGYDIYEQANIGAHNPAFNQQNVNNQLTLADVVNGVEFSGGHLYGGYHYSIAFVDQNTSGLNQALSQQDLVDLVEYLASLKKQ